jgi:aldehyde dehydrogenase (NAD+)
MIKVDDVYVDGQWTSPADAEWIELEDPSREEVFASVALSGAETMDRAVASARRAFDDGAWTSLSHEERLAYLVKIGTYFTEHAEQSGELVLQEVGLPMVFAKGGAMSVAYHVGYWQQAWSNYPWVENRTGITGVNVQITREPVGVVAAIVPWNAPVSLSASKLVPALLAGCTMVLKPSPLNAVSLRMFAEAAAAAGLPAGVLNVVPAGNEASDRLVRHPGVDKIAFTGSDTTGRRIAAAAAETLKRVTLELGGKSAGIVLDDAPLDRLVKTVPPAFTLNNGEACAAMTRMLVPRSRQDEIVEALAAEVGDLVVGDPRDPATAIGPLAFRAHYDRVRAILASAPETGARIVCGGPDRPESFDRGYYVKPTILADVDPDSSLAQEEIFGPVLSVIPYDEVEDAVAIANGTAYGLSSAVFGADDDQVAAVGSRMRAGSVHLNNGFTVDIGIPFGGFKASGYGREFGPEGLEPYLEQRATFLDGQPYSR